MRKLLPLVLLVGYVASAQTLYIPDLNFKTTLLSAGPFSNVATIETASGYQSITIDTNGDGEIQQSEAATVTMLDVSSADILSLEGIQGFINLKSLNCSENDLTSLNVSGMYTLQFIYCQHNALTVLDISGVGPNFRGITCSYNNLETLLLPPSVEVVDCGNNQLTTLNLSGCSDLYQLDCTGNQFEQLNLAGAVELKRLYCPNNVLTSLEFSAVPKLTELLCDNNMITSLDFSGNPQFNKLSCKNNDMRQVNIKNGKDHNFTDYLQFLSGNPNFEYLCCDQGELDYLMSDVEYFAGLSDINATTYCSFTPGGTYNTITGNMIFDGDNNGCSPSDGVFPMLHLAVSNGANSGVAFSNGQSAYSIYAGAGTFTLAPVIENPSYFAVSPTQATVAFSTVNGAVTTQNFCLSAVGNHADAEVAIVPLIPARPGFNAVYRIILRNKGNMVLSGSATLTFQDDLIDFVSAGQTPTTATDGTLTWAYANLSPLAQQSFDVTFNVNSPVETPAVNIGDELNFSATIGPVAGDELPDDNTFGLKQVVVGSFDPNDKQCLQGEIAPQSQIGEYLYYVINFENTGNFPAENVVIKDMIDADKFDIPSLQILGASHADVPVITGNKLEFYFEGINLAPNAYGYVAYKIRTKPDLPIGTTVTNKANIYFDFNFPVETNTASTTFQQLGFAQHSVAEVKVYPNPTRQAVYVSAASAIRSIVLYDVQGRQVKGETFDPENAALDVSGFAPGVYFLKTMTDDGLAITKIVRE